MKTRANQFLNDHKYVGKPLRKTLAIWLTVPLLGTVLLVASSPRTTLMLITVKNAAKVVTKAAFSNVFCETISSSMSFLYFES
jgi:hypothetical protein